MIPPVAAITKIAICLCKFAGGDDKMSSSTTDDNTGQSLTAALLLPTDLSFTMHNHGASPGLGPRHGQKRSILELVQGAPLIPDRVEGTSGMVLYAFIYN
jgi:hypothetical protein